MSLKVVEKFASIQGEGFKCGYPAVFVRLQGCMLSCPYCDSKHATDMSKPAKYTINTEDEAIQFADKIAKCPEDEYPINLFVFTGGEPFLNNNVDLLNPIVNRLCWYYRYTVDFETTLLTSCSDLKDSDIGTNMSIILDKLNTSVMYSDGTTEKQPFLGTLVVCPKLDMSCYPSNITLDDVFSFYTDINKQQLDDLENCDFKLVYYPKVKSNILKLVELLEDRGLNIREQLTIMPYTPIGDDFSRESYVSSCIETIDFCKKNGFIYSPRIHIDVWDLKNGV